MKHIKKFESFVDTNIENQRSESQILSVDNFEDLLSKLTKLSGDTELSSLQNDGIHIPASVHTIKSWMEEVVGTPLYSGEGSDAQMKIKTPKAELIEEVIVKLKELKRFCQAGKYMDIVILETISDMIQVLEGI